VTGVATGLVTGVVTGLVTGVATGLVMGESPATIFISAQFQNCSDVGQASLPESPTSGQLLEDI
jgi:hypothetical protein